MQIFHKYKFIFQHNTISTLTEPVVAAAVAVAAAAVSVVSVFPGVRAYSVHSAAAQQYDSSIYLPSEITCPLLVYLTDITYEKSNELVIK